jgi:hypothetical protein
LAIWGNLNTNAYYFQTEDVTATHVTTAVNFQGNQEGQWNYYYFSYSYPLKQAQGFIAQGQSAPFQVQLNAVNYPLT